MYEYRDGILCIKANGLYPEFTSYENYKNLKRRDKLVIAQRGGNGRKALVKYDSLPQKYRDMIECKYGDPYTQVKQWRFEDEILPDTEAITYYSTYKLEDGRNLPDEKIREYQINASILNACDRLLNDRTARRKALGGSTRGVWESIVRCVRQLDTARYAHSVPTSNRRLRDRLKTYKKNGYQALIHRGYCNDNSRKVTSEIEALILSLYCLPNKPYRSQVHELYFQFLGGSIDVTDVTTGELLDREDFFKDGVPVMLTDVTISNYLNDPKNRVITAKLRSNHSAYKSKYEPFHHRAKPKYALSKISMDDRDIPHKMADGSRVKAYYAIDVASEVYIGYSHSRDKDQKLFVDCVRDMFNFLSTYNLPIPMEVEVEHHLVNQFADTMMADGNLFPMVRWCNPGNSQEKHAEHRIKQKKYGFEKATQAGIGRHYLKNDANVPKETKVWTEAGMTTKTKVKAYDTIVADDVATIQAFNGALHSNQKKYPGMSRLDVFFQNINPDAPTKQPNQIAKWIGDATDTSILRSQYVRVQYERYQIPSLHILSRLKPNNTKVTAYYIPDADGVISDVHLYQSGVYICSCQKVQQFNTARAEWTDADQEAYNEMGEYVGRHRAAVKQGIAEKISRVEILQPVSQEIQQSTPEIIHSNPFSEPVDDFDYDNIEADDEAVRRRAIDSL